MTGTSLTDLLNSGTEVFGWFIDNMTTLVGFIVQHPILLVMLLIMLSGAVVGMFSRIFHSV